MIVTQDALGVAVQEHPLEVVTEKEPLPPPGVALELVGLRLKVQAGVPGWVIVTVIPAIVRVPVRVEAPGLGSAE